MPIDASFTVKPKEIKKYKPVPDDKYQVQITDINLVKQLNQFNGLEEDRMNFEFTILDNKTQDIVNEEGETEIESLRGRKLWKRIAPSNSPAGKKSKASWFFKLLCAIEKKELTDSELVEIAPATLIGQQLVVMVEINGEWNNILSFAPATKDLEPVPAKEDVEISEEELEGKKKD